MKVNYEVAKQYDARIVSTLPDYDEAAVRKHFATRFPNLSTVVINCFNSRATGVVPAVARDLPNQVYPGEVIFENGDVKSTTTIFPIINAGGHAEDALRSIGIAKYFFNIKNVIVVHHTRCGAWMCTPHFFFKNWRNEYGKDPSLVVPHEGLGFYQNYAKSWCATCVPYASRQVHPTTSTSSATSTTLTRTNSNSSSKTWVHQPRPTPKAKPTDPGELTGLLALLCVSSSPWPNQDTTQRS